MNNFFNKYFNSITKRSSVYLKLIISLGQYLIIQCLKILVFTWYLSLYLLFIHIILLFDLIALFWASNFLNCVNLLETHLKKHEALCNSLYCLVYSVVISYEHKDKFELEITFVLLKNIANLGSHGLLGKACWQPKPMMFKLEKLCFFMVSSSSSLYSQADWLYD